MPDPHQPDPRMGDEDEGSPSHHEKETPTRPTAANAPHKEVRLRLPTSNASSSEESNQKKEDRLVDKPSPWLHNPVINTLLIDLKWIPANWTWSKLKPVIRGTIVAFVSVLLLVISRAEHAIGNVGRGHFVFLFSPDIFVQASFLILIGMFGLN